MGRSPQERVHREDRRTLSALLRRLARLSAFRVALLATLAIAACYLPASQLGFVQQLEGQLLDLRFRLRAPQPASAAIVLVEIDDRSLREIGRWPWSRGVIAALIGRLEAAGARTIALDLLLAEPEAGVVPVAALAALQQALTATGPADPAVEARSLREALADLLAQSQGDRLLAEQIAAGGNVALPILFELGAETTGVAPAPPAYLAETAFRVVQESGATPALGRAPVAARLLAPTAGLGAAAATLGHGNAPLDQDGAARIEHPAIGYGAAYYPSFSLEAARLHLGVPRDRVRLQLGRGITLGDRFVPTDESMRMPVNYGQPGRFPAVSVAALMNGEADARLFEGKLVLIGGTAAGVGNAFVTPFSPQLPGIERHATVVDSILRQDFLARRQASALLDLAEVVVGGLLIGWSAARRGLLGISIAFATIFVALTVGNFLAFTRLGLWLNLFLPLVALSAIWAIVLAYHYLIGQRQERRLRAAFKHYLSATLVEQVARDPTLLRLGGEQKELTVLFADLRNSTRLATALAPARFAELLNELFAVLTRELFDHGGMLDKFVGDGLVAVFGAPLPQPDHALRACRAALAMQARMPPLQARWARADLPPLELGIGINTGPMIIGNMGSKDRFSYTVIGEEAHLGARLEAANKDFRTRILISEATWRQVEHQLAARELDVVTFRGLDRPVRVLELLGESPLLADPARQAGLFAAGLAAYRDGEWAIAQARFEQLLAITPDDRPSQLYLERCLAQR